MPRLQPIHHALRVLALAGLLACGNAAHGAPADLVVYGRIWTGDSAAPWAAALAVTGDTVRAVGDSASIAPLVGPATRVLANGAAMVVPGFMDGHLHFTDGGFQLASVDLRPANTPGEFIARLKAYAAERRPGEWILGGNWDHERWPGAPLPRREWIDSVTPNNPVFVYRLDGHMGLANSAALRAAKISRATRDILGGVIVRDPRTGEATGVLKDMAMGPVERAVPAPTDQQRDAALRRALAYAASKGVTAFGHMSVVPADLGTYLRAKAAGALTARAALYFPLEGWRAVADTIAAIGRGDDWVWIGGVKGYMDGSLGSTTALFYAPYDDDPTTSGLLGTPEDSLRAWIGAADSAGLQVAVHAIGERANGLVLDIYDSVARAHGPRDRRFRIEHAQHLRRQDIDRLARSGVIASMQPYHAIDDGRWAQKRIGPERIRPRTRSVRCSTERRISPSARTGPWRRWIRCSASTPRSPGARSTARTRTDGCRNRRSPWRRRSGPIPAATRTACSPRRTRGRLAPGYKADLVLLDQDLTRIAPEAIERVAVRATVVGGRVVYQAK